MTAAAHARRSKVFCAAGTMLRLPRAAARFAVAICVTCFVFATPAFTDTAWMIAAMAFILMRTIPGLALFYAGMARKKNVLATMAEPPDRSKATRCCG